MSSAFWHFAEKLCVSTGSSTLVKKANPSTCSTPKSTRNLRTWQRGRFGRQCLGLPLKCFKCCLFQGIQCFSYLDLLRRDPPKLMTGRCFHGFLQGCLSIKRVINPLPLRQLCDSNEDPSVAQHPARLQFPPCQLAHHRR